MTDTAHPLAGLNLPEKLTFHFQPYGTEVLGELSLRSSADICNGTPRTLYGVGGVVLEGSETSRLFQHTSTRSTKGERRVIWGVSAAELARGELVRVAM